MIFDSGAYKAVDFKKIYTKANEFLVISSAIQNFPFKVKDFLYEQTDIRLCSFCKAREKYDVRIPAFGSDSAILIEEQGKLVVFYNQNEPNTRVRFSIIHEFAHYLFNHVRNLKETDPLYHTQEMEANIFAAQLLMPEQLLRECSRRQYTLSIDFIENSFGVSNEAAQKRRQTLAKTNPDWKSRAEKEFDDIILYKYAKKLNMIAPEQYKHSIYDDDLEYEKQLERDTWLDSRTRWNY